MGQCLNVDWDFPSNLFAGAQSPKGRAAYATALQAW